MSSTARELIDKREQIFLQLNGENIAKRKPTYEELETENKELKEKLESLRAVILELTNLAS